MVLSREQSLVGRDEELAAIRSRVRLAAAGQPGVVWIEGEAGAGKTALLRAALQELPGGCSLTRAETDELSMDLPFELIHQLGAEVTTSAFPTGLSLLQRWGQQQDDGLVVVAVEDLHWADPQSRLALLTATRRLSEDRVLVMITTRLDQPVTDGWERIRLDPQRCLRIPVGALSLTDVTEMARQAGLHLSPPAARRLHAHTGGLPIYVRTLLSELPAHRLEAGHGELPAPRSLAATVNGRLAGLPPAARDLAAALAVVNRRSPLYLIAQVGNVGEPAETLDALAGTGFVTCEVIDGQTIVEFAHPLYRTAVYADLAPSRRRALHAAAATTAGEKDSLAHRVAAADRIDDTLADDAVTAASAEQARDRPALAARDLLWASQLTSRPGRAEQRLLLAARLLLTAGQTTRLDDLRDRVEVCRPSALRSYILGRLAYNHGQLPAAIQWLSDAAGYAGTDDDPAAGHPGRDSERADTVWTGDQTDAVTVALAWLAVAHLPMLQCHEALSASERALARHSRDRVRNLALIAGAVATSLLHGPVAGLNYLADRSPGHLDTAEDMLLMTRGEQHFAAGQLDAAEADLRDAIRLAGPDPQQSLPDTHARLARVLIHTGNWDQALVNAHVALSLASDDQHQVLRADAHQTIACVLACRGRSDEAARHMQTAADILRPIETVQTVHLCRIAEALKGLADGDPDRIIDQLSPLTPTGGNSGDSSIMRGLGQLAEAGFSVIWWPWLITALLERGELDTAAMQLGQLTCVAAERHLHLGARIAGLRGALAGQRGQPQQAVAFLRQAIKMMGPDDPFLDRALLHQSLGQALTAQGDHSTGLHHLQTAHQMFAAVGAAPFIDRLKADLPERDPSIPADKAAPAQWSLALTERESDVAALAADGLTNTEIAARLYVSVNTVQYHLRNIFTKLGLKSRRELRHLAAGLSL